MDTDTDLEMTVEDTMEVDEKSSDLMELFEQSIADFMAVEQLHSTILEKLQQVSSTCTTYDLTMLQKLHEAAMEHVKATGSSNFGALLLK
jgi:predicted AAA+ superfamily ATPase